MLDSVASIDHPSFTVHHLRCRVPGDRPT